MALVPMAPSKDRTVLKKKIKPHNSLRSSEVVYTITFVLYCYIIPVFPMSVITDHDVLIFCTQDVDSRLKSSVVIR